MTDEKPPPPAPKRIYGRPPHAGTPWEALTAEQHAEIDEWCAKVAAEIAGAKPES